MFKLDSRPAWFLLSTLAVPQVAWGTVYQSVAEAQERLFPGKRLTPVAVTLSDDQAKAIQKASGVRVRGRELRVWRVEGGGFFLIDEVLGKHEFIPYAVGLDGSGGVVGIEILEYRETYGDEIRDERWRRQFLKAPADGRFEFGTEIKNISGATLSCSHVTDGVNRMLATHELVLRKL